MLPMILVQAIKLGRVVLVLSIRYCEINSFTLTMLTLLLHFKTIIALSLLPMAYTFLWMVREGLEMGRLLQ